MIINGDKVAVSIVANAKKNISVAYEDLICITHPLVFIVNYITKGCEILENKGLKF